MGITSKKQPSRTSQTRGPSLPGVVNTTGGRMTITPTIGTPLGKTPLAPGVPTSQAATPASPAGPGMPGTTVAPNPQYDAQHAILQGAYNHTIGQIDQQEGEIKNDYGFDDLSNPFSRAALLQTSWQNQQRGTTNSLAAQGQLYSGHYGNQQAIDTRNHDVNYNALRTGYDRAMEEIGNRRTNAKDAFDQNDLNALQTTGNADLGTLPDPSTVAPDLSTSAPSSKAPLSTKAAARRAARKKAGVGDTRGLSPAAVKALRAKGLLPG